MNVKDILKSDKKKTSHQIKLELKDKNESTTLNTLLDVIFHHSVSLEDTELLEWCKWLLSGGLESEEFAKLVLSCNNAATCGLVWTANFVAYRCRTCAISPCMALCADCFHNGSHVEHDFNMFRSQAGGACDCGDPSVLNSSGFCQRHGKKNVENCASIPFDTLIVAKVVMPRMLSRLLHYFRENSIFEFVDLLPTRLEFYNKAVYKINHFLGLIISWSDLGVLTRSVITEALTDPKIYHNFNNLPDETNSECRYLRNNYLNYEKAIESLPTVDCPQKYSYILGLKKKLQHNSLLDELTFWTVKYQFPEKLVRLLLNMLPDPEYKEIFIKSFVLHYSRISVMLARSVNSETRLVHPETLANKVVHVSVQLFSNKNLAFAMTDQMNLLEIMIISLLSMMLKVFIPDPSSKKPEFEHIHYVVNCNSKIMVDHCYWPLVSDLNNILSHQQIAIKLMDNEVLLEMWFHLLSVFQGMNINERELASHIEYEPNTYYAAFSAELDASASLMWSLLSHLKDHTTLPYTMNVLKCCKDALEKWLDPGYCKEIEKNVFQVSFHLPLHRYYALFMSQAVSVQNAKLEDVLPSKNLLQRISVHLINVQAAFYEILCGMWVRNGVQIKGQAVSYIQCHFCNSMVDPDIYLLQICATEIEPSKYLLHIFKRFHIFGWLKFYYSSSYPNYIDDEQEIQMAQACLTFLATLMTVRTNLGLSEFEVMKQEIVTILCVNNRTHSKLLDLMPEKCSYTSQREDFELALLEVGDYKAPNFESNGAMQQGIYIPKPETWEYLYDPIHVLLRAVERSNLQDSLDRFRELSQKDFKSLWPPYRLPIKPLDSYQNPAVLLQCRTFHSFAFMVLLKCIYDTTVPEIIIALIIYLLEIVLDSTSDFNSDLDLKSIQEDPCDVCYNNLDSWFSTDILYINARKVIKNIAIAVPRDGKLNLLKGLHLFDDSIPFDEQLYEANSADILKMLRADKYPFFIKTSNISDSSNYSFEFMEKEIIMNDYMKESIHSTSETFNESNSIFQEIQNHHWYYLHINESLISLLLKLHSKLSGYPDSYNVNNDNYEQNSSRIGDGPFFIDKVLNKLCILDSKNMYHIQEIKNRLYGKEKKLSSVEKLDKKSSIGITEEKKRKAKEMQQRLLAEFASKQRQFLQNTMDIDNPLHQSKSKEKTVKLYHCNICKQSTPSTEDNLVALVVHLQATNMFHSETFKLTLPLSDTEKIENLECTILNLNEKFLEICQQYNRYSVFLNSDYEHSIFIQSCGHYVHMLCHKSYMDTLKKEKGEQESLDVDHGEYSCPVCKQLANSLLPIFDHVVDDDAVCDITNEQQNSLQDLKYILYSNKQTHVAENISLAIQHFVADIIKCFPKSEILSYVLSTKLIFFLFCSLISTNLDLELIQRNGTLCQQSKIASLKKSISVKLIKVLAYQGCYLKNNALCELWLHVSGLHSQETTEMSCNRYQICILASNAEVLFIRLLLLTFMSTNYLSKSCFSAMVKSCYNILFFQILIYLAYKLTGSGVQKYLEFKKERENAFDSLENLFGEVVYFLQYAGLLNQYTSLHPINHSVCNEFLFEFNNNLIENEVKKRSLHFLRICSILQHHLYDECLPEIEEHDEEFWILVSFLGISNISINSLNVYSVMQCLNWICDSPYELILTWFKDYISFCGNDQMFIFRLMEQYTWKQPYLLELPQEYDKIFQYYNSQKCYGCNREPKDPSVCLVCGDLICLRETCCRKNNVSEAVRHSMKCGAGTGIFLVINSSVIIVIRGKRACLWGCVYLDSHGEEDRDLKRGKPLFLNKGRYHLLEQQWIHHSFDHTNKIWVWHKDKL